MKVKASIIILVLSLLCASYAYATAYQKPSRYEEIRQELMSITPQELGIEPGTKLKKLCLPQVVDPLLVSKWTSDDGTSTTSFSNRGRWSSRADGLSECYTIKDGIIYAQHNSETITYRGNEEVHKMEEVLYIEPYIIEDNVLYTYLYVVKDDGITADRDIVVRYRGNRAHDVHMPLSHYVWDYTNYYDNTADTIYRITETEFIGKDGKKVNLSMNSNGQLVLSNGYVKVALDAYEHLKDGELLLELSQTPERPITFLEELGFTKTGNTYNLTLAAVAVG